MRDSLRVEQVRCFGSTPELRAQGLRCFANVIVDDFIFIDGLAVRRTERGDHVVTWPERRDGQRRSHPIVKVLDDDVRAHIERLVLEAAKSGGWIS